MKTSSPKPGKPGFISYVLVLTTGAILTMLMVFTYRQAMATQVMQSQVQLRNDYSEKEDAILRSIVAITPNRAIRAMQSGSGSSTTISNPLRWRNIFDESLAISNARTSISPELLAKLDASTLKKGNSGDSTLTSANRIFHQIAGVNDNLDTSYASAGINRSLGTGFPVPLQTNDYLTTVRDSAYPIITNDKFYGALAESYLKDKVLNGDGDRAYGLPVATYSKFNILKYPAINFGYAKQGDPFVAKRNWWAFTMDLADHDDDKTATVKVPRDFVISIYEIPSQLAISASSFLSLGQYASGDAWQNVSIKGGVFAGKAEVQGALGVAEADDENRVTLASRRGMTLPNDAMIGGKSVPDNPFTPGVREAYQVTEGEFFPVSLASESGRVAFIPINRGPDFFDRLAHAAETNTVSTTTWNNYSVGALQCAMRLDITQTKSSTDSEPTHLRFSYLKAGNRVNLDINLISSGVAGLPPGYLFACNEDSTYNFGTAVVDLAYGASGVFGYQMGMTGSVTYNNARFGDPVVGAFKSGYYKPSYPFEIKKRPLSNQWCVWIYPQRFKNFLASLNADDASVNHSLAVNVDYTTATGSFFLTKPAIPCTDLDYGLVLQECADFTAFPKGFSLVSNLRSYIGDDFNIVQYATTPPTGYTPPAEGYYPPCSLFVPEKRYGLEVDPRAVNLDGQVGSLASEDAVDATRPLDSKTVSGEAFAPDRITVNLRPITHPVELPPITMMNWLVVLEERRK
jgi:hypothetical protein